MIAVALGGSAALAMDALLAAVIVATIATLWGSAARPEVPAVVAVLAAPFNAYRFSLPGSIPDVGNVSLFRAAIVALGAGLALRLVARTLSERRRPVLTRELQLALAAIVCLAAYEAFEATRSLTPLGTTLFKSYAFYLTAAAVLATGLSLGFIRRKTLLTAAIVSAVVPLGFALYQVLSPGTAEEKYSTPIPLAQQLGMPLGTDLVRAGGLSTEGLFRPAAFFSDPNFLAVFAVGSLMLTSLIKPPNATARAALVALRAAAVSVTLATLSRTGLILLTAYAVLVLYRDGRSYFVAARGRLGAAVTALAVVSAVALASLAGAYYLDARDGAGSTASHVETIRWAVELGAQYPLTGAGLANYGYVVGQPLDRSSAQSFPFTVFAEQGIVGVLLFASLLAVLPFRCAGGVRGLPASPLLLVFVCGVWFYDYVLAMDVCAVWLALLLTVRMPPRMSLAARATRSYELT